MKRANSISATTPAQPGKRRHTLFWLGVLFFGFYLVGFGLFVAVLPKPHLTEAEKADAIVALTGQGDRLAPAVALLESGHGKRLLITGVNPRLNKQRLKTLVHGGRTFDCCADLGFAALDTRGNAAEAARWAREKGYRSLIVVTADYHMPRSLVEFSAEMPDVKLLPYPVTGDAPGVSFWQNMRRLNGEYAKYIASVVRVSLAHPASV